jgi:cytosine/adenosine deaminase-related metal-dependent hydrolase
LAAATSVAARACGVGSRKGRLAPGFDADILAVAGDPTTDVRALLEVRAVFRAGRRVLSLLLLQLADVHGLESRGMKWWRLLLAVSMFL